MHLLHFREGQAPVRVPSRATVQPLGLDWLLRHSKALAQRDGFDSRLEVWRADSVAMTPLNHWNNPDLAMIDVEAVIRQMVVRGVNSILVVAHESTTQAEQAHRSLWLRLMTAAIEYGVQVRDYTLVWSDPTPGPRAA